MGKYGHNTVAAKWQFTVIYGRKLDTTTVYIIVFDRLGNCNPRLWYSLGSKKMSLKLRKLEILSSLSIYLHFTNHLQFMFYDLK
jgi:hypothetical protein